MKTAPKTAKLDNTFFFTTLYLTFLVFPVFYYNIFDKK